MEIMLRFPDDATAEAWFVERRWPNAMACPYCGSAKVQSGCRHKAMPYRCREYKVCGKRFSGKTGTVMEGSKLGFQTWMIATFLLSTNVKSVSSVKLHRDLNINQRSAWFLAHRLRVALSEKGIAFAGPVEMKETYFADSRENTSNAKRKQLEVTGRGAVGKVAVVGAKDRKTSQVAAQVVERTDKETLQGSVVDHTKEGATVCNDDAIAYDSLAFQHESVKDSLAEYVRGDVHTNGVESLWATMKRTHKGTFHKISPKHLDRYLQEFAARHNLCDKDTFDIMSALNGGSEGKRLTCEELFADNGLVSGARS